MIPLERDIYVEMLVEFMKKLEKEKNPLSRRTTHHPLHSGWDGPPRDGPRKN